MLKLVLATVALVFSWRWLRAELSRMLEPGEPIRPTTLAVRAALLIATVVWFLLGIAATFGRVFGWMLGLAVVGAIVWYFVRGGDRSKTDATPPEPKPESDSEPDQGPDKTQN